MLEESIFEFEHNEQTGDVTAVFFTDHWLAIDKITSIDDLNFDKLTKEFSAKGWDTARINPSKATEFIDSCRQNNLAISVIRLVIANVINGQLTITISQDKLTAFLEITPPVGGVPITLQSIEHKLTELEIVFGINYDLIAQLAQQQHVPPTVIAQGIPSEESKPAYFVSYIEGITPLPLQDESDEDLFDLLSLKKLPYIKAGTPIMRLVPNYEGVDGKDVFGKAIPPTNHPTLDFADNLKGIKFDEMDPKLLIAAREGKPILHRNGMSIVPYQEINLEGITSKFIEFEGALVINGDLHNGMHVKVSGDIAVDGTIGLATVEASGRISTSGGIVGAPDANRFTNKQVNIVCQGDIRAKFIENANISTSQSVFCEHAIIGSQVVAGGSIIVGKRGEQMGIIRGGKMIAFNKVIAGIIGFDNGLETHIHVGIDLFVEAKKRVIKHRYDEVLLEKQKLDKLVKLIFEEPERGKNGIGQRVTLSREAMKDKLEELRSIYQLLEANSHGVESARIMVYDTLHEGTTISIGNRTLELKRNLHHSTIYYGNDGEIKIGSIALSQFAVNPSPIMEKL